MPGDYSPKHPIPFSHGSMERGALTERRRRSYSGMDFPMTNPVRIQNIDVADKPYVTNWINKSDIIAIDYQYRATYFPLFAQQTNRCMVFVAADDGDMAAVSAAATLYGCQAYMYNLEGVGDWVATLARLNATLAALAGLGDTRPLMFAPILFMFDTHAADFSAVFRANDGWWLQMWNPATFPTPDKVSTEVASRVAIAHALKPGCPMYIQTNCYSFTADQCESIARNVAKVSGVTAISLWFQAPTNWSFCKTVLKRLRPY